MERSNAFSNKVSGKNQAVITRFFFGARVVLLSLPLLFLVAGCGGNGEVAGNESALESAPVMTESLDGLILEGEGPIPARLIYRSRNSLSNEEDRLVLEEISMELDRLVELAGRLDDAVGEETAKTDNITPEDGTGVAGPEDEGPEDEDRMAPEDGRGAAGPDDEEVPPDESDES